MWSALIPAAIGAGSSLIGGMLGQDDQKKQSKKDYERQKEFAQNSIRWRVADAEAAGLHPLAALGASTASYSSSVGGSPMAAAVEGAGSAIAQGASAFLNPVDKAAQALLLEKGKLENELLAAQIATERARLNPGIGPPGGLTNTSAVGGPNPVLEPIPGSNDKFRVSLPGYGQRMEDHYGDVAGSVPGAIAGLVDLSRHFGIDPNDPLGSLASKYPPAVLTSMAMEYLFGIGRGRPRKSSGANGGGGW